MATHEPSHSRTQTGQCSVATVIRWLPPLESSFAVYHGTRNDALQQAETPEVRMVARGAKTSSLPPQSVHGHRWPRPALSLFRALLYFEYLGDDTSEELVSNSDAKGGTKSDKELQAIDDLCSLAGLSLKSVLRDAHRELLERVTRLLKPSAPWFDKPKSINRYWMFLEGMTHHVWQMAEVQQWYATLRSPSETREAIPPALRYQVLQRDHGRCAMCGRSGKDVLLHIDHIVPWDRGGPTELDNLVTLCWECNLGKSDSMNPGGAHD